MKGKWMMAPVADSCLFLFTKVICVENVTKKLDKH